MDTTLHRDMLAGQWEEMKSRVKQRWGRLTDDQLDQIDGYYDELTRLVRECYGYTKEKAREEVDLLIARVASLEERPEM